MAAQLTEGMLKLAKKYLDKDIYPFRQATEVRVILKIVPDKIVMAQGLE